MTNMMVGPQEADDSDAPILELSHVSKSFGSGEPVLNDVTLRVYPSHTLGLIGQNGSGKSTLVKLLSGYHTPDPGAQLRIRGRSVEFPVRRSSLGSIGLSFVHQDHPLIDSLTVAENLLVGRYEHNRLGNVSWAKECMRAAEVLEQYGLDCDPDSLVLELSQSDKALLSIARAVDSVAGEESGVVVLDEPTSALGKENVVRIASAIRTVASNGYGIIFVSHRLEEIMELTDDIVVLRDGVVTLTGHTADIQERDVVRAITGRRANAMGATRQAPSVEARARAAAIRGLTYGTLEQVSLDLSEGEILGLTGLDGSGFQDVVPALCARANDVDGTVDIGGMRLDLATTSISTRLKHGLVSILDERARTGLAMAITARENFSLPTIRRHSKSAWLSFRSERESCREAMARFGIRPSDPELNAAGFSGGNAQKLLLAKWIAAEPKLLTMLEPTQGVDVGAKEDIFEILLGLSRRGVPVIIASNEISDLRSVCDRIVVFDRGSIVADLDRGLIESTNIEETVLTGAAVPLQ